MASGRHTTGLHISLLLFLRQAKALVDEEEWLAKGSLGKGHGWEAVELVVGETNFTRSGKSGTGDRR